MAVVPPDELLVEDEGLVEIGSGIGSGNEKAFRSTRTRSPGSNCGRRLSVIRPQRKQRSAAPGTTKCSWTRPFQPHASHRTRRLGPHSVGLIEGPATSKTTSSASPLSIRGPFEHPCQTTSGRRPMRIRHHAYSVRFFRGPGGHRRGIVPISAITD